MDITADILESGLQCRYKSYLQLLGEQGLPSEYERLLRETRARVRLTAMDKLLTRYGASESLRHLTVTPAMLKCGAPLVLDATVEDERLALRFDALQRAPGRSDLGDFHYTPVLFHEAERPSHVARSLLALYGVILSTLQGRAPAYGLLIHGQGGEVTRIPLSAQAGQARRVLEDLMALQPGTPPRLMLNNHCPLCEFRHRCQAETPRQGRPEFITRAECERDYEVQQTRDLYRHPALLYFPAAEEAEDIATQAPAASGRLTGPCHPRPEDLCAWHPAASRLCHSDLL